MPSFQELVNSRSRFNLFLLAKLPAAFFSGVKLRACTATECVVDVPFRWFTQNPFRSTYFACLSMGAELSTGALCMQYIYGRKPALSMLITASTARYHKKATGVTRFTCSEGAAISKAIDTALESGLAQEFTATSVGKNSAGEIVAEFSFTWSFKAKTDKATTI
ncbi:MAG: DUF4442 domain-containing protein [Chitinophagaceae bacterium]|nr:MAG: DUF4442 domain-containing protein [Chitinophagaceae bacterium]